MLISLAVTAKLIFANKGADQLCSYCEADLRLFFRIGKFWFSHDETHLFYAELVRDPGSADSGPARQKISVRDTKPEVT